MMQSSHRRLRNLVAPLSGAALLPVLALIVACNGLGGGSLATFVDDGQSGTTGAATIADACESSADCQDGLRCLEHWNERFCVETCAFGAFCSDRSVCKVAINAPEDGWCDPGIVRRPADDSSDDPADDPSFDDPDVSPPDDGADDGPTREPAEDPSGDCGTATEARVIALLNEARRDEGLPTLGCDGRLGDVARLHAQDMAERDFFDHTNPDGQAPWDRMDAYGIGGYTTAGENIAAGYATPADVHEGWMNSPGHRDNILGEWYTDVGVGVWEQDGTLYWTQLFAAFE